MQEVAKKRILILRNPKGTDEKGKFVWKESDLQKWLKENKAKIKGYEFGQHDGQFVIDFDEFLESFKHTYLSLDNTDWSHVYFLRLDDRTERKTKPGKNKHCGEKCIRHEFTIESKVD